MAFSGDGGGSILGGIDHEGFAAGALRAADDFDDGVFVKVEDGDFAILFAKDEAIEPDLVVLVAGVPTSGFLAFLADNGASDFGGDGIGAAGNLLRDADDGSRGEYQGFLIGAEACGEFGFVHRGFSFAKRVLSARKIRNGPCSSPKRYSRCRDVSS